MGIRDLKLKYGGKNLKNREAVNRAIRAELVAGDDVLDALESLHCAHRKLSQRNLPGTNLADDAAETVAELREVMESEIRRRYDCAKHEDDV